MRSVDVCSGPHEHFRAVDIKYYKQIFYGTFRPEHLTKLAYSYVHRSASDDIQEENGMVHLMRCFEVYGQVICHFAHPRMALRLYEAWCNYRIRLAELSVLYKFDTVREYNYAFMTARMLNGQDDPRPGLSGTIAAMTSRSESRLGRMRSSARRLVSRRMPHLPPDSVRISITADAFETTANTAIYALYVSRITPPRTALRPVTHWPQITPTTHRWENESRRPSDSQGTHKYPLFDPSEPDLAYHGPLRVDAWEFWMNEHPDITLAKTLPAILRKCAKIGHQGHIAPHRHQNHRSALDAPDILTADLQKTTQMDIFTPFAAGRVNVAESPTQVDLWKDCRATVHGGRPTAPWFWKV